MSSVFVAVVGTFRMYTGELPQVGRSTVSIASEIANNSGTPRPRNRTLRRSIVGCGGSDRFGLQQIGLHHIEGAAAAQKVRSGARIVKRSRRFGEQVQWRSKQMPQRGPTSAPEDESTVLAPDEVVDLAGHRFAAIALGTS